MTKRVECTVVQSAIPSEEPKGPGPDRLADSSRGSIVLAAEGRDVRLGKDYSGVVIWLSDDCDDNSETAPPPVFRMYQGRRDIPCGLVLDVAA